MKFIEDRNNSQQYIKSYNQQQIVIANQVIKQSFVITSQGITILDNLTQAQDLCLAHIEELIKQPADILLLGLDQVQSLPPSDVYQGLVNNGVGFELMCTHAACRTYNILLSERRTIAALFII